MTEENRPKPDPIIDPGLLQLNLITTTDVHWNVSQQVVVTTEDKLRLCLSDYIRSVEASRSWLTPFALLTAIVTTLVTSSFKDIVFSAATWEAFYLMAAVLSFIWLLSTLKSAWGRRRLDDLIQQIKQKHPHETVAVRK